MFSVLRRLEEQCGQSIPETWPLKLNFLSHKSGKNTILQRTLMFKLHEDVEKGSSDLSVMCAVSRVSSYFKNI